MSAGQPQQPVKPGIREILTDALRFWEWRRLFYNLVPAAVVLLGTVFAAVLTHFFATGMFGIGGVPEHP